MIDREKLKKLYKLDIPPHMIERSAIGFTNSLDVIDALLDSHQIPNKGWNDNQISYLLTLLSGFDSDKDIGAIRIGEREGRVASVLNNQLAGGFCHGIGRSGDLTAAQPKAAGASLLQNLTNKIVLSLIRSLDLPNIKGAITVPLSTGMALALTLRGLLNYYKFDFRVKPQVLMTQVDHRSPMKGVEFIGGKILTIPGVFGTSEFGKESVTVNMNTVEDLYQQNKDQISAIISNSCFFSPRVPDPIKDIAKFAQSYNLIHIINNAYGLQSPLLSRIIRQAIDAGRVDAIVQSTDKCFLTPVGGSVIISPTTALLDQISQAYAGRASATPVVQLLVSLLSLGKQGYIEAISEQQHCRSKLEKNLCQFAPKIQEHVLDNANPVSCALSLMHYSPSQIGNLGGFLYNLRVTGPRVINTYESAFGTCCPPGGIPWPYIVMNAAIGVQESHISEAVKRLEKALHQL